MHQHGRFSTFLGPSDKESIMSFSILKTIQAQPQGENSFPMPSFSILLPRPRPKFLSGIKALRIIPFPMRYGVKGSGTS